MGFELVSNGSTCIVPEAFLLFSSQSNINRISLQTSHYNQPIPIQGVKQAVAIDFHFKENRIYVTDVSSKVRNWTAYYMLVVEEECVKKQRNQI